MYLSMVFFLLCVCVCVPAHTLPSQLRSSLLPSCLLMDQLRKKKINHSSVILYLLLCAKTIFPFSSMRFHLALFIKLTLVVLTGCWCRLPLAGKAEERRIWRRSPWSLFDNPGLQEPTVESSTSVWDQKSSFVLFWYPKKKSLPDRKFSSRALRVQQHGVEFCSPTGFSTSFPDMLFPQPYPACDLITRVCVCECVSCVASGCKCRESGRLGCVKGSGQGSSGGFVR